MEVFYEQIFTAQRLKDTAYVTVGAFILVFQSMRSYCQINLSQAEPMALVLLLIMFSGLVRHCSLRHQYSSFSALFLTSWERGRCQNHLWQPYLSILWVLRGCLF